MLKTGDTRSKGQMFTPKTTYKRDYSTPRVAGELSFDTFYFPVKAASSKNIEFKKFMPVLQRNKSAGKLIEVRLEPMKMFGRSATVAETHTVSRPKSKFRTQKKQKDSFKEFVNFSGTSLKF